MARSRASKRVGHLIEAYVKLGLAVHIVKLRPKQFYKAAGILVVLGLCKPKPSVRGGVGGWDTGSNANRAKVMRAEGRWGRGASHPVSPQLVPSLDRSPPLD